MGTALKDVMKKSDFYKAVVLNEEIKIIKITENEITALKDVIKKSDFYKAVMLNEEIKIIKITENEITALKKNKILKEQIQNVHERQRSCCILMSDKICRSSGGTA